ncbi:nucleoside hydrolase [Pengzhenrongella sicca]|uniref:Nucleoside hydrolase n=1 Tax=Pengzhenrongella sicca TaxID=2819238 RepID=A0A8A4Z7V1_9MICO|nr:nucleoside hydrolase [Pengzhenrongella sicca]QTE27894.1 nucleoside hydrolase [Pengzhenrongella sicca]
MPPAHRLIICTDAKNEADDQFAIVHALLTSTLDVRGIVPSHFGRPGSMVASREEVHLLLELLGTAVVVADGSPHALPAAETPVPSAGARLIVAQARAESSRLYVAVLGPLTDVASAILAEPSLRERDVVVVWVGGPPYEGVPAYAPEFNLINDVAAANVVLQSGLEVWQIPMPVYTMVGVGHAELEERLRGTGPVGDYLVDQLVAFNATVDYGPMDFRSLGDSPAIGAVMNPAAGRWSIRAAPRFTATGELAAGDPGRTVRVCESFDTRWLLEDMFAKLRSAEPRS